MASPPPHFFPTEVKRKGFSVLRPFRLEPQSQPLSGTCRPVSSALAGMALTAIVFGTSFASDPAFAATPRDQPQTELEPVASGDPGADQPSLLFNGGFDLTDLVQTSSGMTSDEHAGFGWIISADRSPWELNANAGTLKMVASEDFSDFQADMAVQIVPDDRRNKGPYTLHIDVRNSSSAPTKVLVFGANEPFKIYPSVSEGPERNRKEPVGELLGSFLLEPAENDDWQHYQGTVDLKDGFNYLIVTIEPPRFEAAKDAVVEVDHVSLVSGESGKPAHQMAASKSSAPNRNAEKPKGRSVDGIDLFEESLPPYSPAFETVELEDGQSGTGWRIGPESKGMAYWSVLELDASKNPNLRLTLEAEQSTQVDLRLTVMTDAQNRLEQTVPVDLEAGEKKTYLFPLVQMRRQGIPMLNALDRIELQLANPDSAPKSPSRLLIHECALVEEKS